MTSFAWLRYETRDWNLAAFRLVFWGGAEAMKLEVLQVGVERPARLEARFQGEVKRGWILGIAAWV